MLLLLPCQNVYGKWVGVTAQLWFRLDLKCTVLDLTGVMNDRASHRTEPPTPAVCPPQGGGQTLLAAQNKGEIFVQMGIYHGGPKGAAMSMPAAVRCSAADTLSLSFSVSPSLLYCLANAEREVPQTD